ncbi:hypothetical protein [Streptomyces sp. NPDC059491]|uniref:hypothetical protein n=1 Tax=Streptomyces sp. NPDC059491 TaxID=3346850 RepID=UPI00367643C9
MHADIHLSLHRLHAAELHRRATATARPHGPHGPHQRPTPSPTPAPAPALRVRLGWRMVEFGLRLATPGPAATSRFTTAA